ncbi:MAG: CBS domain-containing protein [Caulobacteraceae bacterium]
MLVSQIIRGKGAEVLSISPGDTVAKAAAMLREHRIGALVVRGAGGKVAGILSERDIVWGVAKLGEAALQKPVSDCMTKDVIVAAPNETVDQLMARMTDKRIRHLPVVSGGELAGIVSIGDLVKHKIGEIEAEAQNLKDYIATG